MATAWGESAQTAARGSSAIACLPFFALGFAGDWGWETRGWGEEVRPDGVLLTIGVGRKNSARAPSAELTLMSNRCVDTKSIPNRHQIYTKSIPNRYQIDIKSMSSRYRYFAREVRVSEWVWFSRASRTARHTETIADMSQSLDRCLVVLPLLSFALENCRQDCNSVSKNSPATGKKNSLFKVKGFGWGYSGNTESVLSPHRNGPTLTKGSAICRAFPSHTF